MIGGKRGARRTAALLGAMLLAATGAGSARAVGETGKPTAEPVILHGDVPLYTVYAWERWGNFINAQAGSATEIPYDAARLQVKVYTYPTGEIRAIRFANGVRTHRHVNQTDTILYSWQTHRVHFVDDKAVVVGPGDFALHQKGVYHSGEEIRRGGGIDLEFAVNVKGIHNDPTAIWSLARDHPVQPIASWMEGDGYHEAIGEAAASAPANAARYRVRVAAFTPELSAREVYIPAGTRIVSRDDARDRLIFVLSGKVAATLGGRTTDLASEDTARAERGKPMVLEAREDTMLAQAFVPALPAK
jgi:quercetin dioxygenase-like cupin family protein